MSKNQEPIQEQKRPMNTEDLVIVIGLLVYWGFGFISVFKAAWR